MPLRLAGEDLDDIRVRLYGHDGKPLLLGGPAGNQLQVVAVNPDGTPLGGAHTDDAPFTPASDDGSVAFAVADDTAPDSVDEGDAGAVRMSLDRILYVRPHGIREAILLAAATRTATASTSDQTNETARGALFLLNITARTVGATPLIAVRLQAKDFVAGSNYQNLFISNNFDPSLGLHLFMYYPGITNVSTQIAGNAGTPLPRTWRGMVTFEQNVTDLTFSLGAALMY